MMIQDINILAVVLDLMHVEVCCYQMVVSWQQMRKYFLLIQVYHCMLTDGLDDTLVHGSVRIIDI